ncbi:uncharacterized protein LOC119733929, partial [Patiria miniata]|uniref:Tyr recombinase domain-containing protein n=1 Tax=Patiria miniata TaxID=46514 RepID=A0A914AHR5_PATMI
ISDPPISSSCPHSRAHANPHSTAHLAALTEETHRLISLSLADGSRVAYQRAVDAFQNFRLSHSLKSSWPATSQDVMTFVAHLSLSGRAASTISVHVAAISCLHKMHNWDDPTQHFLVKKMQEGCRRQGKSRDIRRPITWDILAKITSNLDSACASLYECILFRSAFLLAFFGLLRVGELTVTARYGNTSKVIAIGDIQIAHNNPGALMLRIRYSKNDQYGSAVMLRINGNGIENMCPVQAMGKYLVRRPAAKGPLFCHANGAPLTRYQFGAVLRKVLHHAGVPPLQYGTHSFRIGAATTAALNGLSPSKIQTMGRWRSDAFKLYIRK